MNSLYGGKSGEIEPPNPDINDHTTLNLSILTKILKLNYLNYTNGFHRLNNSGSILSGEHGSLRPEFADNKGKVLTCTEMFLTQELFKFYYAVQFQTYSPEDRNGAMEERFEDFKPSLYLVSCTGDVGILSYLGKNYLII